MMLKDIEIGTVVTITDRKVRQYLKGCSKRRWGRKPSETFIVRGIHCGMSRTWVDVAEHDSDILHCERDEHMLIGTTEVSANR